MSLICCGNVSSKSVNSSLNFGCQVCHFIQNGKKIGLKESDIEYLKNIHKGETLCSCSVHEEATIDEMYYKLKRIRKRANKQARNFEKGEYSNHMDFQESTEI